MSLKPEPFLEELAAYARDIAGIRESLPEPEKKKK
jgi:hypothetical protein